MSGQRILIVDDDELVRHFCARVLKRENYDVKGVESGKEALDTTSKESFDMVITDMMMPGMDGLETFIELRKGQPEIVGVLMTAHGTMDTAIEAMALGFSNLLRKPFTPLELTHVVKDSFFRTFIAKENVRLKTLIPLYDLAQRFLSAGSQNEVLDAFVSALSDHMGFQRASVMLYDTDDRCLKICTSRGLDEALSSEVRVPPGKGLAGMVFEKGEPLIIHGGRQENPELASYLRGENPATAICFPLKTREKTIGVLNVSREEPPLFSKADLEMLSVISRQAVMAIENLRVLEERAEKLKVRTLLEQYVAPEVADILISREQDPMEVGEMRDITILHADIRNFTPLVRHLPLKTLRSFLNAFFGLQSEIIFSHRGTLDKFIGDAVLAYFGALTPMDDPNTVAVKTAIEMQVKFGSLREEWAKTNGIIAHIGLGIGISSGRVFLGNVGSSKRFDYTVIGADVNIAQRLASEAGSGQILITKPVTKGLNPRLKIVEQDPLNVKGLTTSLTVYTVQLAECE